MPVSSVVHALPRSRSDFGKPDTRPGKSVLRLGGDNFKWIARQGIPGTAMPKMGDSIDDADPELIRGYLEAHAAQMK